MTTEVHVANSLIRPGKAIGPAKHFVGRQEELAAFGDMLEHASRDAMPQLAVLQAPPGAGKTALLAETAARAEAGGSVVLEIPAPALEDPELLRERVVSQLARRDRWRELLPALEFGLPAGGLVSGGSVSVGPPSLPPVSLLLRGLESLSRRSGPDGRGPSGILLLLDEAQRLARHSGAAVELLLEALRERPGLRTLTVLSGLPDTLDALDSPSLARADRILGLGWLDREESVELLRRWLEDNDFRAEGATSLDFIADHARDWPEFLVHHTVAMLEAAAENGGLVDREVVRRANDAAEPAMREYYEQRLRMLRDRPRSEDRALLALANLLAVGLHRAARVKEALEAAGAAPELLVRLAHAGVLVERLDRWSFAIPGLSRHILDTRGPIPRELMEDLREIHMRVVRNP